MKKSGAGGKYSIKTVSVYGIAKSELAREIKLMEITAVDVACRIRANEIQVMVSHPQRSGIVEKAAEKIAAHLGLNVFSTSGAGLAETVAGILREKKLTVATAESCTGGMLASALTDIAGSSSYFPGGAVAYSNESKTTILGVSTAMIEKEGAVSGKVAIAMANTVKERFGSDIGVGITGIAGPGGGSFEKPVGTVYIAVSNDKAPDDAVCVKCEFKGKRSGIRSQSVSKALDMIRRSAISVRFKKP